MSGRQIIPWSNVVQRFDSFFDAVTGVGRQGTKGNASCIEPVARLTAEEIEILYHDNWLARRIIETVPRYAMSQGFLAADAALAAYRRATFSPAYPEGMFLSAAYEGRAFGGAGLLLGSANMASPISDGEVPTVQWLAIVNRNQLDEGETINDPNATDHGQPALFTVTKGPRKDLQFHPDHAIWFGGVHTLGDRRDKLDFNFFNDSVLQPVHQELARFDLTWSSVSAMIQEASLAEFQMKGMPNALSQENKAELEARMSFMSTTRSVLKTIFLDEGESFTRHGLQISGVADATEQLLMLVSGAAEIPQTRLFGRSPDGMNATGASDEQIFDDRIQADQESQYAPKLERLVASLGSASDVSFPPLHGQTEEEEQKTRKLQAESDKLYVDMGGVDALAVTLARHDDGTLGIPLSDEDVARMRKELAAEPEEPETPPPDAMAALAALSVPQDDANPEE